MNIPNPELQLAEAFIQDTHSTLFLTGKAGTGKTTFLHAIKKQTHKRMVVTAPTGVAAVNAGGVTLHSFFQIPFGPFLPGSEVHTGQHRFSTEKKNLIRCLDLLVIDEISMVRADLLDGVDSILRRYRRSEQPFGGVQLLMIGDLLQLSPVVKEGEWQILKASYDSPYFFSSNALRRIELIPIELKHIYRQSDDRFIELLNQVRNNQIDSATLQHLNTRYLPEFSPKEGDGCITLCTHNRSADVINQNKLANLPGTSQYFSADVEGTFPEHTYPVAATLELKMGAQVMFARNDTGPEKRYFNGKIGKISGMTEEKIEVACPGEKEKIEVGKISWENIEYAVDAATAEISQKIIGTFNQYPLKPAWAITIHKSQGLTFDRAVIDAQAAFAYGQVYVALSRCRTFEGLVLSSPLSQQAVKTDATILRFVAEAEKNAATPAKLAAARIHYQQQLLLECFDFLRLQRLLSRLTGLLRGNASVIHLQTNGNIYEIQQQIEGTICSVGENFKRQIQSLFTDHRQPATDPVILERLAKASLYFQEKFMSILLPCLDALEVETDNKDIRKKIADAIKLLREETVVKLAAVRACDSGFSPSKYLRALSAAVLGNGQRLRKEAGSTSTCSETDISHLELFQNLRRWRAEKAEALGVPPFQVLHQKPLVQIANHLPENLDALRKIKGIGKRLAEKFGAELVAMVADYSRQHGLEVVSQHETATKAPVAGDTSSKKEDSKRISLELLEKGLSIQQIAAERGLTAQTIEGHLAFFVKKGTLAVNGIVPEDKRRDIEKKIMEVPGVLSLKELKTILGDAYSYGEINLVLAHLHHLEIL